MKTLKDAVLIMVIIFFTYGCSPTEVAWLAADLIVSSKAEDAKARRQAKYNAEEIQKNYQTSTSSQNLIPTTLDRSQRKPSQLGIIHVNSETNLHLNPGEDANIEFQVEPTIDLKALMETDNWIWVQTPDYKRGWIAKSWVLEDLNLLRAIAAYKPVIDISTKQDIVTAWGNPKESIPTKTPEIGVMSYDTNNQHIVLMFTLRKSGQMILKKMITIERNNYLALKNDLQEINNFATIFDHENPG